MRRLQVLALCAFAYLLQGGPPGAASAAETFTISGYVWFDANGNRLRSLWEPKQRGATITLLRAANNALIRAVRTNALGVYAIRNVPKGSYRLAVTPPAGFTGSPRTTIALNANAVRNFPVNKVRSREERSLNAFGDRWSLARSNPSLGLAPGTGCYRKPAPGTRPSFSQEELNFQRALRAQFYVEGCAVVLEHDPPFWNNIEFQTSHMLKARVSQFKAANPKAKYIAYIQPTGWEVGQLGWKEINENHRDWFVYKKGAPQTEENIVRTTSNYWVVDITNPAYQDFMAARLAGALTYYGIDGVILDSVLPAPRIPDLSVLPDRVAAGWQAGWVTFLAKVRAAVRGKIVLASLPRGETAHALKIIPVVDGIVLEDTFSPVRNDIAQRISRVQPIIDAATARGKLILATANTKVDGSNFTSTNPVREHTLARYYLAAYYIFSKGKMFFYHNPPAQRTPQYGAEAFFTDWNIKVGVPVTRAGAQIPGRRGVYKRTYSNAVVFLNSSNSSYVITVPRGSPFKFDPDGTEIARYVLQPKTAFILSRVGDF